MPSQDPGISCDVDESVHLLVLDWGNVSDAAVQAGLVTSGLSSGSRVRGSRRRGGVPRGRRTPSVAQIRPDGYLGPGLVTLGERRPRLPPDAAFDGDNYSTGDVVRYLTGEEPGDTPDRTPCAALRGG